MLLLIINGSPKRGGNIATMLNAMRDEATRRGAEVAWIDVADLHVEPCRGCMACRTAGKCTLPYDDAQRTIDLLRRADALIVGAPCYWGNIPGQLKVLFDRMVYGMMGESPAFHKRQNPRMSPCGMFSSSPGRPGQRHGHVRPAG